MTEKKSKISVSYSKGMPSAHCGICKHFIKGKPNTCELVKGTISVQDWCKLFKKADK